MGFRMKYQNWRRSHHYSRVQNEEGAAVETKDDTYEVVTALAKLAIIMGYFYLCDRCSLLLIFPCVHFHEFIFSRTNFFMKENKYFSQVSFWLPVGYVFALGLFFTEDSRYTKVLHRDQTDEWKGIFFYNQLHTKSNFMKNSLNTVYTCMKIILFSKYKD